MPLEFVQNELQGFLSTDDEASQAAVEECDDLLEDHESGALDVAACIRRVSELHRRFPDNLKIIGAIACLELDIGRLPNARAWLDKGLALARAVIPSPYHGLMEWSSISNRPFLRLLHHSALQHIKTSQRSQAIAELEELLRLSPNDNVGARYLLGSEYLRDRKYSKAKRLLLKESGSYPPYLYELGLLYLRKGELVKAATALRKGMIENIYIIELLCGTTPHKIPMWHYSNFNDIETAQDYVSMYGGAWSQGDCQRFLVWIARHPRVMLERARIFVYQERLLWTHDFEARGVILREMQSELAKLDDQLSQELVMPKTDRYGKQVLPWMWDAGIF